MLLACMIADLRFSLVNYRLLIGMQQTSLALKVRLRVGKLIGH